MQLTGQYTQFGHQLDDERRTVLARGSRCRRLRVSVCFDVDLIGFAYALLLQADEQRLLLVLDANVVLVPVVADECDALAVLLGKRVGRTLVPRDVVDPVRLVVVAGHDREADEVVETPLLVAFDAMVVHELLHHLVDRVQIEQLVRHLGAQQQLVVVHVHGCFEAGRHFQMVLLHLVEVVEVVVGTIAAKLDELARFQTSNSRSMVKYI